jgi:phenylalanyl-tRNA synthetase beta chain
MKLSPHWIRDFVDLAVDDRRLGDDLTSVGMAVEGTSGSGENAVFEMEIGTNRPDAMNHYGLAREAAAIYDVPLKAISPKLPAATRTANFPIEIEDSQGCARFTARILHDLKIKPSPEKVSHRLGLLDQRPINNAVDATNYVLWEMGKPTHVFDLDLLEGGKIIVRRARDGEMLKTLDGVERKLTSEDLVVADAKKPVGLAGTMGGFDTMITDKTRNVLIESAWWDPVTVRKMSRRHGLHTDASHRFERGADFESTILSCDRVAELILQSGGGELVGEPIDVVARRLDQAPIALRVSEAQRILGRKLDRHEIARILKRLGFEVLPEPGEEFDFTVQVPSWRLDVEREIDLIEEVARLYGYDKFQNTLPLFSGFVVELPDARKDAKLRNLLMALGYNEAVSLTFISHEDAEDFSSLPVIELENPLSEEASVMRTSLVPGILNLVAYNLNRDNERVRLFETGNVFEAAGSKAVQTKQVCFAAAGLAVESNGHRAATSLSFFDMKGDIETLLDSFEHRAICLDSQVADYYHHGRAARVMMDGVMVAQFGQVHPEAAAKRKFRQEVFLGEIYLDRLYRHELHRAHYDPLPRYPAVTRDFSCVFEDSVSFEKIQQSIDSLNLSELQSFVPAEIFRGGAIPAGKYSILLRASFQSRERTLREEEVAQWSSQIVRAIEKLGGVQRT